MINKVIKISFLLPTFNCGLFVRRTFESIKWADEIVVIDSFSNDNTIQIAKEYDAKVYQHEYINSAKQKNWALQYCTHDWVFQIDSDEILDQNAEIIIRNAVESAQDEIHSFRMSRKNHVLGKWVKYGGLYPDWEYRLFRKKEGKWWDRDVHSRIIVSGEIEELNTHLIHYGMPNITKQISNLDRYTRYEADQLKKRNIEFSFLKWLIGPLYIFLKRYIFLQGFRDGWRGFYLAIYASYYVFLSHTKLLELNLLKIDRSPK
jgi:glycosyltransferase involved in cell wall biosynthesis